MIRSQPNQMGRQLHAVGVIVNRLLHWKRHAEMPKTVDDDRTDFDGGDDEKDCRGNAGFRPFRFPPQRQRQQTNQHERDQRQVRRLGRNAQSRQGPDRGGVPSKRRPLRAKVQATTMTASRKANESFATRVEFNKSNGCNPAQRPMAIAYRRWRQARAAHARITASAAAPKPDIHQSQHRD